MVKEKATLRKQIVSDEGTRQFPYRDSVGKTTIGVGRNLEDVGLRNSEVTFLLDNDIEEAVTHAMSVFPLWDTLPAGVQHVIVNMIFQLGAEGFRKFRKFISHVKRGDYSGAADEVLDSLAAKQAPERFLRHAQTLRAEGV